MTKLRTSNLDAVIASAPLDGSAASVTSRGTHWEPKPLKPGGCAEWDSPPPLKPVPRGALDLTGHRHGRFYVLGLLDLNKGKNAAASWVVRCSCGTYSVRSAKALRNPANVDDCCRQCRELKYIRRTYEQLGSKPAADFFTRPK